MDLGTIKQKIAEDKAKTTSSYRRYPVRFLFMELTNNTQNEIMELVKGSNGELLELSDFIMRKNDGWLTKSHFIQVIKNNVSTEKDTFVLGFSEMIRFYSRKEIEATVLALFDIENSNTMDLECASRRIYFICFSMMDNVYKVLQNSFPRRDLIDPFLNSDYELSGEYRKICFVSDEYCKNVKENKIATSVEWIGLWRHAEIINFSKPIWCCSSSLYEWHKKASPDNAFQIDSISNTKEYLQKALGCEIAFIYQKEDEHFWLRLLGEFEKSDLSVSLKQLISSSLGVNAEKTESLAAKLITTDEAYEKWVIRNYVMAYFPESYLAKVINNLKAFTTRDLLITVWIQGYRISHAGMLEERLRIIKELNKYADSFTPEEEIRSEITSRISTELSVTLSIGDSLDGLNLLAISNQFGQSVDDMKTRLVSYYSKIFKPAYTGISNTEKEFLINLYVNEILDKEELRVMYPLLFAYLFGKGDNLVKGKEEYKIYLDNYRQSKVKNEDTGYLAEYYSKGCASADSFYEMYYSLDRQDSVVKEKISEDTDVYVVDGVGAEYVPLLTELINQNGYEVVYSDYAVAHLPSITDVNKAYLNSIAYKKWIVEFDRDVIHGEFYKSANNIRKSLDMLSGIVKKIIEESWGRRIVITADHGATARAKWTDTKKKYNFTGSDHEGRCCKLDEGVGCENTSDYIVYEDEINLGTKYIVSLNETSLLNRPRFEDHGGATIEEVLVPVMVAMPHNDKLKVGYKVLEEKLDISGLDKVVRFAIVPDVDTAFIIDGDGVNHVLNKVSGFYQAELSSGKEQEVTVVVGDQEFKFKARNTAKKNMEGDDGFDD